MKEAQQAQVAKKKKKAVEEEKIKAVEEKQQLSELIPEHLIDLQQKTSVKLSINKIPS